MGLADLREDNIGGGDFGQTNGFMYGRLELICEGWILDRQEREILQKYTFYPHDLAHTSPT